MIHDDPLRDDAVAITPRQRLTYNTRCLVCQDHGDYVLKEMIRPFDGRGGEMLPYFVCKEHAKLGM